MAYWDGWKSVDFLYGKDGSSTTLEKFRGEDASATAQKVQGEDKLNNNGKFRGEKAYAIYWGERRVVSQDPARTHLDQRDGGRMNGDGGTGFLLHVDGLVVHLRPIAGNDIEVRNWSVNAHPRPVLLGTCARQRRRGVVHQDTTEILHIQIAPQASKPDVVRRPFVRMILERTDPSLHSGACLSPRMVRSGALGHPGCSLGRQRVTVLG